MEDPHRHSDDDVNLERYSRVLAAWWREIVFSVLLAAAMGGAATLVYGVVSPKYKAAANVAIVPARTTVALNEESGTARYSRRVSQTHENATRAALVGFVRNGDVARKVNERLGKEKYSAEELFKMVSSNMVSTAKVKSGNVQSNLIRITARADSQEDAVAIADAWAEEYVSIANRLHRPVATETITSILAHVKKAEKIYEESQVDLEMYISRNDSHEYARQIEMNIRSIDDYWDILKQTEHTLLSGKISDEMEALNRNRENLNKFRRILSVAESLLEQTEVEGKSRVASEDLALHLLKIQTYTLQGNIPEGMEVTLGAMDTPYTGTASSQKDEIRTIIDSLQKRIIRINADIEKGMDGISGLLLEDEAMNETGSRTGVPVDREDTVSALRALEDYVNSGSLPLRLLIADLEEENRSLRAKIEASSSRQQALMEKRDQALSTVQAIRNGIAQLQLANSIDPTEVRLASSAVALGNMRPSPTLGATVIGAAWMPVAALLAFFMNFLGIRPFLERRET